MTMIIIKDQYCFSFLCVLLWLPLQGSNRTTKILISCSDTDIIYIYFTANSSFAFAILSHGDWIHISPAVLVKHIDVCDMVEIVDVCRTVTDYEINHAFHDWIMNHDFIMHGAEVRKKQQTLSCAPLLGYFIVTVVCIIFFFFCFYICSFSLMSWWGYSQTWEG